MEAHDPVLEKKYNGNLGSSICFECHPSDNINVKCLFENLIKMTIPINGINILLTLLYSLCTNLILYTIQRQLQYIYNESFQGIPRQV